MKGLIFGALAVLIFSFTWLVNSKPLLSAPSPPERAEEEASQLGTETLHCGEEELWRKASPEILYRQDSLEAIYRLEMRSTQEDVEHRPRSNEGRPAEVQNTTPPPYTLPIVFHILHDNGTENLSDARIQTSLDQLNASFANTGYYDQGTGVNTEIQFCLAQRTPDNLASNGITRTVTTLTDLDADTQDLTMKDLARWDTREYVNVYVVREICGLGFGCSVAGYAYYPGAHGSGVDGIVVEARWLGDDEAGNAVLTHELGHYLGLRHTFNGGCLNDDCLANGDLVCDTPPDNSTSAVPCSSSANTCTTDTDSGFATDQDDMHINYMDYGYFSCYSALTAGQRDRMHFFINGIRQSLLDSYGCLPPCPAPITASFSGQPGGNVIVGSTLNLTNTSTGTASYEWYVNGSLEASTTNFNFTFTAPGTYTIRLLAISGDPLLCQNQETTIVVNVVCPYVADLTASSFFPIEFNSTNFSTTADAPIYEWTVDGIVVGNAPSLDYSFPGSGIYELCLRKGDGACEQQACEAIFVGNSFQPCQGQTFAQFIEVQFDQGFGSFTDAIVPDGGNLLVAGDLGNGIMMARMTAVGQPIWSQWVSPTNVPGFITDLTHLLVDSEGNYVMTGYLETPNSSTLNASWIMRYDPVNEMVLYFNYYMEPTIIIDVYDDPMTDTYRLTLNRDGFGDAETAIQIIDRASGGNIGPIIDRGHSHAQWALVPQDAVWYNDQLYVVGRQSMNNGTGGNNPFLQSFTAAADPVFANQHFVSTNQQGGGSAERLVVNTDGVSVAGILNGDIASNPFTNLITFSRFNLAGDLLWENHFQIFDGRSTPTALQPFNGGYLLSVRIQEEGITTPVINSLGLIYLNIDGNLVWARKYEDPNVFFTQEDDQCLFTVSNFIFWIGEASIQSPGTFNSRSFIFRLDEFGGFQDECLPILNLEVEQLQTQIQRAPYDLTSNDLNNNWIESLSFQMPINYLPNNSCGSPCFEICGNGIDDDFNGDVDCEDAALANTCCCLPGPIPPVINDTILCPGETWTIFAPPYEGGIEWSTGSTERSITIDSAATYSLMVVDSCGRDSLVSFTVNILPPSTAPDLGPDQEVCANGLTDLDAGPGWVSYLWFDLTTEQTTTAWGAGDFWVEVTDSCGQVFGDTLTVTVLPTSEIDLGPADSLIDCSLDSLNFSVNGYANYRWSPTSVINCNNCPSVRVESPAAGDSLTLFVIGFTEDGCAASDSIMIRTSAGVGLFETAEICAGASFIFRDSTLTSPGEYLFPAACGAVDTLSLTELPLPLPSATALSLCAGDSIFLAGAWRFAPAMFTDTLAGANGCDSLHTYDLQQRSTPNPSQELVEICPGDSAFILGQWESAAGDFPVLLPTTNGCDSVHTFQLRVLEEPLSSQEIIDICAGDSAFIDGDWRFTAEVFLTQNVAVNGCDSLHEIELIVWDQPDFNLEMLPNCSTSRTQVTVTPTQGQAPFQVLWNTPPPAPILLGETQNLPAGNYEIEVRDANNCFILATVSVPEIEEIDFELTAEIPACAAIGAAYFLLQSSDGYSEVEINGQAFTPADSMTLIGDAPFQLHFTDTLGCVRDTLLEATNSSSLNLNLLATIELALGDSIQLFPQVAGGVPPYTYSWSPGESLSCGDCLNPWASPLTTTTYQLIATDSEGCLVAAEVTVQIDPETAIYVPSAFSPNGDGVNDTFWPGFGPAGVQINRFQIYDRWGGRLYSEENLPVTADPGLGWDGRSNGKLASPGVYVYLLEVQLIDGRVVPLAGEVVLVR